MKTETLTTIDIAQTLSGQIAPRDNSKTSTSEGKKGNAVYYTTTGIICLIMTYSAINFAREHPIAPGDGSFAHLGLPEYFKIELTTAKLLGVSALLIPGVPSLIKEFAYFGFAITLVSASIAHFSSGDGLMFVIDPMIFLAVLFVSFSHFQRRRGLG